jgi:hypothetical protein
VPLSVSVLDCDVWPKAGVAIAMKAAESSHTDFRIFFSPARRAMLREQGS